MSIKKSRKSRNHPSDYTSSQGAAAIGGRLRRLSERIDHDATRLYAENGFRFEQRWFGVLNQLVLSGPMSVGELAAALGISHASVSQTRQSLEKAGLTSREPDRHDARSHKLHLTRAGQKLAGRLTPLWDVLNEVAVELNEEAGDVVAALEALEAALNRLSLYERVVERLAAHPGR